MESFLNLPKINIRDLEKRIQCQGSSKHSKENKLSLRNTKVSLMDIRKPYFYNNHPHKYICKGLKC